MGYFSLLSSLVLVLSVVLTMFFLVPFPSGAERGLESVTARPYLLPFHLEHSHSHSFLGHEHFFFF